MYTYIQTNVLTYKHTNLKLLRDIHTTIRTKLHIYMHKYFRTNKHSK